MSATLTRKAREFVRKNRSASIVSGQWLNADSRPVLEGPETWVKLRYRFDDGTQFTLTLPDAESLHANGIEPIWWASIHPSPAAAASTASDPSAHAVARTGQGSSQ